MTVFLLLTGPGLSCAQPAGDVPPWSLAAQRRLLDGPGADPQASQLLARRLAQEGEDRLAVADTEGARQAFDRAAMVVHSADVEVRIVRNHLQAGNYRQALGFASHAAGAHKDQPGAAALYAWLLHMGGQGVFAQRLLGDALARHPDDSTLLATGLQLRSAWPEPTGPLLDLPQRAAPYAQWPDGDVPAQPLKVAGNALLLQGGQAALVPVATLGGAVTAGIRPGMPVWLRNGLGQTVAAEAMPAPDTPDGFVRLRLQAALPWPEQLRRCVRAPFAGSPGYTLEYAVDDRGAARWPLLLQGFFGRAGALPHERALGLATTPGPRGGPVFDAFGQLCGLSLPGADGRDRWLPLPEGAAPLAQGTAGPGTASSGVGRVAVDELYETGLRVALQVLVSR